MGLELCWPEFEVFRALLTMSMALSFSVWISLPAKTPRLLQSVAVSIKGNNIGESAL